LVAQSQHISKSQDSDLQTPRESRDIKPMIYQINEQSENKEITPNKNRIVGVNPIKLRDAEASFPKIQI
jgi:hypothetical protein